MPISQLRMVRHKPIRNNRNKRKKFIVLWLKRIVLAGIAAVMLFSIYLIGAFAWYSRSLPDPNKILERDLAQSTKIYDRTGETVLYDIHGDQKRTLVKLDEIPEYVQHATISAEDRFFYEHSGFNIVAMFKGVIIDPLLGKQARGGSTLTQQFVKNSILTNERRLSRKIKEFILSYKIEKSFTKDEILQMYLNEIPYGSVAYGVQSASYTFFNKDVKDLSIAEAAILASLPKAPTYYSPYGSNQDRLFARQQYIIDQMAKLGYITEEEAETAKAQELKFAVKRESITAPHFVMYIKEIISEKLGDDYVESGGLKVITTLDLDKQMAAEEAVVNGVEKRGENYGFHNAALISLDPKTGQILAMVGSKDYFDLEKDGNVNVTLRLRQPGSSIKPMIYAAAFKKGYTPNTILYDVDTNFKTDTKDYAPKNYDLSQNGPVTIRKALAGSLNTPAVKAIYLAGVSNVIDFLELLGYTSFEDRSRFGLALVLGGGEVRLIEHAAAFGTFANQGVANPVAGILRVEDSKGNIILEYENRDRKVLDSNVANQVTNVLSDNGARAYAFGASNYLTLSSRAAAAKTGTTNDYRDAWTMGYTPSLVTGVWVGNNDNTEMKRGAAGGVVAAPIWQEYMNKALEGSLIEGFPEPKIEETGKPILDGAVAQETKVKVDKFSGKLATEHTPQNAIEEKTFLNAHSILHYVYKEQPKGAVPEDPAQADSAYVHWEAAIKSWVEWKSENQKEGDPEFIYETPPTEEDDVHTEANKPTVIINSPTSGQTVEGVLKASVNVSAARGVSRVEYFIGSKRIATVDTAPFSLSMPLTSYFMKGQRTFRVVAFDDVDNQNEASIPLNIIIADVSEPALNWLNANGETISSTSFPYAIKAQLTDVLSSKKIDFFMKEQSTGKVNYLGAIILPEGSMIEMEIPGLDPGTYDLFADIVDPLDKKHRTSSATFTVQ
jgi:1A family penicillin-binding protein